MDIHILQGSPRANGTPAKIDGRNTDSSRQRIAGLVAAPGR